MLQDLAPSPSKTQQLVWRVTPVTEQITGLRVLSAKTGTALWTNLFPGTLWRPAPQEALHSTVLGVRVFSLPSMIVLSL